MIQISEQALCSCACVLIFSNELQHVFSTHSCSYSSVEHKCNVKLNAVILCSKNNVPAIQIRQQYWGGWRCPLSLSCVQKQDNKYSPGHNWQKTMTKKKNMHEFKTRRIPVLLDHISVFIITLCTLMIA